MAEFRYWLNDDIDKDGDIMFRNKRRIPFSADGSVEFELVQEWFPIFSCQGKSARKEIIKWWKAMYPERASQDKYFTKICNHIKWWEHHTDFTHRHLTESNHKTVSINVKV